jgi:hypothetical protein
MRNTTELDTLGKEISDGFVHEGVPLNDGLQKSASSQGLNREQIQRVAESANTETYLSLMKTAKENYVDFPLADFKAVHDSIVKVAKNSLSECDDYDLDYEDVARSKKIEDTSDLEKVADITKTSAEAHNEAIRARDTMKYLDDAAYESLLNIDNYYASLEKIAKQAILTDIPFNNIKEIIKVAAEIINEPTVELLEPRLEKYAPHIDLNLEGNAEGAPNPNSDLYKTATDLQDEVIRYLKIEEAIDHYHSTYTDLVDEYDLPLVKEAGDIGKIVYHATRLLGRTAKGIIRGAKKFPTLATGALLYTIGRKTGKGKGKRQQGKVLSRRGTYKKHKPKIVSTYRG